MFNEFKAFMQAAGLPWEDALVKAPGSTAARSLGARFADLASVKDFGAVGDGTTDDTAAIQSALNTGKVVHLPIGNYKITSPLTVVAPGGIVGDGEYSSLIRFFTGGRLLGYPGGAPITLQEFSVRSDASVTVANGDTGIDIGYAAPWAGRGKIEDLFITGQWHGFKWKGGSVNGISRVYSYGNKGHGFEGVNPRGELFGCLAQLNEGSGYHIFAESAGETGCRIIHCGTFANQRYGLLAEGNVDGANLWLDTFSSSFDGQGGVVFGRAFTQVKSAGLFVEYAGFATDFKPEFTAYPTAPGLILPAGMSKCDFDGTQLIHCKGAGGVIVGTVDVSFNGLFVHDNGKGLGTNADRNGLNIQSGNVRLSLANISSGATTAGQLYDLGLNTADNTGIINGAQLNAVYSVSCPGFVWANVRGAFSRDVASAATITLPPTSDFFNITGAANIGAITASWIGRRVILKFAGAPTVTDGGNLKLAGNFTASPGATLSLVCDGTDWIETSRSVN